MWFAQCMAHQREWFRRYKTFHQEESFCFSFPLPDPFPLLLSLDQIFSRLDIFWASVVKIAKIWLWSRGFCWWCPSETAGGWKIRAIILYCQLSISKDIFLPSLVLLFIQGLYQEVLRPGGICNPCSVIWVCLVVSFQKDVPRMPLNKDVQEASEFETQTTSAYLFWHRWAAFLLQANFRCLSFSPTFLEESPFLAAKRRFGYYPKLMPIGEDYSAHQWVENFAFCLSWLFPSPVKCLHWF